MNQEQDIDKLIQSLAHKYGISEEAARGLIHEFIQKTERDVPAASLADSLASDKVHTPFEEIVAKELHDFRKSQARKNNKRSRFKLSASLPSLFINAFIILLLLGGSIYIFLDTPDPSTSQSIVTQSNIPSTSVVPIDNSVAIIDSLLARHSVIDSTSFTELSAVDIEAIDDSEIQQTLERIKQLKAELVPSTLASDSLLAIYTLKPGETLGDVSTQFYGKSHYWKLIADYNSDIITNPDWVKDGTVIRIPKLPSIP